jgi:hypothetical protein
MTRAHRRTGCVLTIRGRHETEALTDRAARASWVRTWALMRKSPGTDLHSVPCRSTFGRVHPDELARSGQGKQLFFCSIDEQKSKPGPPKPWSKPRPP